VDIYEFLDRHGIPYQRYDHQAVYTCEQADRLAIPPGPAKTKNLFLRDRRAKRHILLSVGADRNVDIKALEEVLEARGLSFASADRLRELLGIEPGSVTILAVLNDAAGRVEVVMDKELWTREALLCHPLVNTSTLVIGRQDIERFLELTGHTLRVVEVPVRACRCG
jgi:Ala-tRNA(Pro) deacylase